MIPTTTKRRSHRRILAAAAALATGAIAQAPALDYTIVARTSTATDGEIPLAVTLRVSSPPGEQTVFAIPVWTPGSYRLRDFPERIGELAAAAAGGPLPVTPVARGQWLVRHGRVASVELRYRVGLHPGDRFMEPSDGRRCITYEGPAVYMYPEGQTAAPCRVRFELPDGWSVASGLAAAADGTFTAANYDVLADCPVKLGRFQQFTFGSQGAEFVAVLDATADLEFDHEVWTQGLRAIVDEASAVFGGGFPFARYWFLFTAGERGGGGGLEHLNSTAIGLGRGRFVRDPASSYGVCAHEFFHCWNVKRLRPIELGPFRYDRPNRTTGLWLSEGVTSYYGDVLLARAGHTTPSQFWRSMANAVGRCESMVGRPHTSPEQASLRVWDPQPPDRKVDYYTAGEVLGLLLDLQIRHATDNKQGLDDALLAMWRACEQQGRGLHAEEIEAICTRTAGADLGAFFAAHVRGTAVPDHAALFAHAGMSVELTRQSALVLRGADLTSKEAPVFRELAAVGAGGAGDDPLQLAGRLRVLDGAEVANADDVERLLAAATAAGKHAVAVEYELANGRRRTASAAIEERLRVGCRLEPRADATPAQVAVREGITRSRRAQ